MKKLLFLVSVVLMLLAASCVSEEPNSPENPDQLPPIPNNLPQPQLPSATNKPVSSFTATVLGIKLDMIAVEGGSFLMGATEEQGTELPDEDEYPVHQVTVTNFYMSKTEVTQELYEAIMGVNPSRYAIGKQNPVRAVPWHEALEFCERLGKLIGGKYTLPTEAQWEYAARGGKYKENTRYAGSNDYTKVVNPRLEGPNPLPVASMAPNALGIYDMSGGVAEWCADRYAPYTAEPQINPLVMPQGYSRVIRGGSWADPAFCSRVSCREANAYSNRHTQIGFRIVMNP